MSLALALISLAGIAATGSGEAGRGAELLRPFKERLQSALREGMARGPGEAIGACRLMAPEIAASLEKDGVRMGRTSHKLRNPGNTAPWWVGPVLQEYVEDPGGRTPRLMALPEGRSGYIEPIFAGSVCLACHGREIAPEIQQRLDELYPEDRAVGFEEGDFRGLFWVEYPTPK